MSIIRMADIDLSGKRVFIREDLNVPVADGKVTSDARIRAALPTIKAALAANAAVMLVSHLGRPTEGQPEEKFSMQPVADHLSSLLGREVPLVRDWIDGVDVAPGDVVLLENVRFNAGEKKDNPELAQKYADLCDVFVMDAFGTAHRAHASTEGVTHYIDQCAAGYLLMKEIAYLGGALQNPDKPFVAILGGAKISGKIDIISNLLPRVDTIVIGGGMGYTFFKAQGKEIGKSLLEEDKVDLAKELLAKSGEKITLPVDCLITDTFDFDARQVGDLKAVAADEIPADAYSLDIGPKSIEKFRSIISATKTIVWNGPMGVFEIEETAKGTFAIAHALADATANGATTIIGGGDSASAVERAGVADKVSHVSTGGGASLEFMEGKVLPGVAALSDR